MTTTRLPLLRLRPLQLRSLRHRAFRFHPPRPPRLLPLRLLKTIPIVLLSFALLPGCVAKSKSYRLVPIPQAAYSVTGGVAVFAMPTARVSVSPLDDAARLAYIQAHAPAANDEFGPDSSGRPRYLTFRLIVENQGDKQPLVFQPHTIILVEQGGNRITPLDYPQAYTTLAGHSSSDPRLLDDLAKYMFDVDVSLAPGERIDRLLIYPVKKLDAKRLRMEFSMVDSLSSNEGFDVLFTREPPK